MYYSTDWYSPRGRKRKDAVNCRVTAAADWAKLRRHIHATIPAPDSWRFLSRRPPPPHPARSPSLSACPPVPTTPAPNADGDRSGQVSSQQCSSVCAVRTHGVTADAQSTADDRQGKRGRSVDEAAAAACCPSLVQSGSGSRLCCGRVQVGSASSRANSRGQAEPPFPSHSPLALTHYQLTCLACGLLRSVPLPSPWLD